MHPFGSVSRANALDVLALSDPDRRWGCALVDLRPEELSASSHLPGSASLPLADGQELATALPAHMLPAAGASLIVLDAERARARAAAEYLASRGYRARWFDGSLEGLPLRPGPCRGALWSPDPFLDAQRGLLPEPEAGPVADWGAGNGRNAVYLASWGYLVHCYDRLPDALALTRDRARRHRLEERILTHQKILAGDPGVSGGPFAAILMIRFHEKSLMGGLRGQLLPEGVVLVHTYAQAPARQGGGGPRRARHHLTPPEVKRLFPARDWSFLVRGAAFTRPQEAMIAFVAQVRSGDVRAV